MEIKSSVQANPRRNFIGTIASGAAVLGMASVASPLFAHAETAVLPSTNMDPDAWFSQIKGKHKMVFDCTQPHEVFPFAWPKVFLLTNEATGTLAKDNSVVVVLRHSGIPYAFEDRIWAKYGFGEVFKANDPKTEKASMRNPFWKPVVGDFKVPGIGDVKIGINELQEVGVMFCVCEMAITVFSNVIGDKMKMAPADVKKDWMTGLLPGIQIVPSGVWAIGRAQEHGCAYCFAG